jgi:hypothetical protein
MRSALPAPPPPPPRHTHAHTHTHIHTYTHCTYAPTPTCAHCTWLQESRQGRGSTRGGTRCPRCHLSNPRQGSHSRVTAGRPSCQPPRIRWQDPRWCWWAAPLLALRLIAVVRAASMQPQGLTHFSPHCVHGNQHRCVLSPQAGDRVVDRLADGPSADGSQQRWQESWFVFKQQLSEKRSPFGVTSPTTP